MTSYVDLNRKFWPVEADREYDPQSIRVMASLVLNDRFHGKNF